MTQHLARRRRIAWLGVAALAAASGCTGAQPVEDDKGDKGIGQIEQPVKGSGWDCSGDLVPPTGYEQETAFVDGTAPNAPQQAIDQARSRLVGRLCGGGTNCDALSARTSVWKQGSGSRTCAMVVIEGAEVERWRRDAGTTKALDEGLLKAAQALLGGGKGGAKVAVGELIDGGVPGGARAEWLAGRMNRALSEAGGKVLEIPERWDGRGVPPGLDIVVQGKTVERTEGQVAVIEVTWSARLKGGELRTAPPVTFARDAAPAMKSSVALFPPSDPGLTVHIETAHPGGGICAGETTQLWLHSQEALHVRVFDLYGEDGATLLFPNDDRPDGQIRANETIKLGGDGGFKAIPIPGFEVERFLVIGARRAEDLGRFRPLKGYCRLAADLARQLHAGQGIPNTTRSSSDGFRLISGPQCRTSTTAAEQEAVLKDLQALPACN